MKKIDIIKAWKNKEYRNSLSEEERRALPGNPVGEPLSDLESSLILAGSQEDKEELSLAFPSQGWVCTISGECSSTGRCCNPFTSWLYL